ncbi:unnamed protein product [Dibothriocephalus latus]|uniref:TRUD domain-containing protein n=1 Tax=Dibothriocephalus latus TaxID=60516 RepID=A0A3P6TW53_DIBLA|nr:unnamed protein product [Dibothriocephalus latus]
MILPIEIDEVLKELDRETMFEASFPASNDKGERERFHKAIRHNYPSLVSRTADVDNNRFVIVTKASHAKGQKGWARVAKVYDPPKETPYCHFTLYKEGKDTMNALQIVGRMLKINSNTFSYAGTKDKRAITTQRVSVKNISSKRLASLNPRLNGIKVGNFKYLPHSISLGDLYGNRFSLAIRDVVADDSIIHRAIAEWQKRGFINYFGLQRFGHSAQAQTFEIGKQVSKQLFNHLPAVRQMKEKYIETQDAKACGENMPQCLEKTLLLGIARHGKTLTAIQTLPRNMRQLYTHSYQSLVWNRVTSRRFSELSFKSDSKAIVGDLFFPSQESAHKGRCLLKTSTSLSFCAQSCPQGSMLL